MFNNKILLFIFVNKVRSRLFTIKRLLPFLMLLAIPLALATSVDTNKASYLPGESVIVSGSCNLGLVGVGLQANYVDNSVWYDQVTAKADKTYSTNFIPPQNGNYTVYAACQGETANTKKFCVGAAADCPTTTTDTPPPPPPPPSSGTPGPGGSSSGGGYYCTPIYSCGNWNNCNASLKQSRLCVDTKCSKPNYYEYRNCTQCEESWDCSLWSDCKNGKQLRTCIDNYYCKTTLKKPALEKACTQTIAPGPAPAQTTQQIPPPVVTATTTELSFWDNYKWFITLIPTALILIGVIAYLILHFRKPKAYNINELKTWIQQEKQAGTPDSDIKQILSQQTGWRDDEISRAFRGLAA